MRSRASSRAPKPLTPRRPRDAPPREAPVRGAADSGKVPRSSAGKQLARGTRRAAIITRGRAQVIVERMENSDIPDIDKVKFLVPSDLAVSQFLLVIRRRIKVAPEVAIYVFVRDTLPPTAATMAQVYDEFKDDDGFLYVTYSGEKTFGC